MEVSKTGDLVLKKEKQSYRKQLNTRFKLLYMSLPEA